MDDKMVTLGLSRGQAGLNPGDGTTEMMVVLLLHHFALCCPNKLLICNFDLLECGQKLPIHLYPSSLRLLGQNPENLEGNFSSFDLGFSASLEPLP